MNLIYSITIGHENVKSPIEIKIDIERQINDRVNIKKKYFVYIVESSIHSTRPSKS